MYFNLDQVKKKLSLVLPLCMVLWMFCMQSCTDKVSDDEAAPVSDDRVEWKMVLDTPVSRAVTHADGSGYFEEGDTLVVFARNVADGRVQHYTLHLSNGEWIPKVYWREIGEEVQFTAWYLPVARQLHLVSQTSSDYLHTLAVSQQGDGYGQSDLLCAQARVRSGVPVQLSFTHALHRLQLILESRDGSYTEAQLQQAEVSVCTPCQLLFNLSDGTLQSPADNQWITPARQADNQWMALLCPQTVESMPADGWIRIRIEGQEKSVPIPETLNGQPFWGVEAGKELTYRLNLQRDSRSDPFAGTTQWIYGVQEPDEGQWNADHTQLSWSEGCGWFDCNKVNPSNTSFGGDGLMCWAAATSNLIHWWLQQNRDTEAVKNYTGPQAVPTDMLHSEIFQLYKNHFSNQGDYPLKAINWFFNGIFHRKMYDTDPVDPAAGFFREQLGIHSLGAEYIGTEMTRDRFNALIKQALLSQQGVLFVVNLGKAWTTHAVTLWGAKFDEEGLIETLYMVDNNDGRYDTRGTIRTMQVQYLPYSNTNPALYPYVPNSLGDFTIRIESLCTLSLGREWIR